MTQNTYIMCQSINSTYIRGKTLGVNFRQSSLLFLSYPPPPIELLSCHNLLSFIDQSISIVCVDVPLIVKCGGLLQVGGLWRIPEVTMALHQQLFLNQQILFIGQKKRNGEMLRMMIVSCIFLYCDGLKKEQTSKLPQMKLQ